MSHRDLDLHNNLPISLKNNKKSRVGQKLCKSKYLIGIWIYTIMDQLFLVISKNAKVARKKLHLLCFISNAVPERPVDTS